ncbi:MAG: hypothetical protein WC002_07265 [Candidatus Muiribacteriota bacterium]|jgi:hypothetical protein
MFRITYLTLVILLISGTAVSGYNGIFPDRSGFLVPGNSYFTHEKTDLLFNIRPFKQGTSSEYIYDFGVVFRNNSLMETGFHKKFFSNYDDPNPALMFKFNIFDKLYYKNYLLGFYIDFESGNYNSAYIMTENIGVGVNFGGKTGGNAIFGGYNFQENKPDTFYILLKYEHHLSEKTFFGVDFNGDNFGLYMKFAQENLNFTIGYIAENDYDKKYNTIDLNRITFGVHSEY